MTALPAILILAAGASARMRGRDKLLEAVDGVAQLARIAGAALTTGCPVLVALPVPDGARAAVLDGMALVRVAVANACEGMAASIRAGVATAADAPGLMIVPADMPDLDTADLGALRDAFCAAPHFIYRGMSGDTAGHPVVFPRDRFADLARLTGDSGARDLLRRLGHRMRHVPLPAAHAVTDLDTQEDWAAWQANRERHARRGAHCG